MSRPTSGRLAGLLVLPLLVLGPFSLMHVPGLVHIPGDAAATAAAIVEHQDLFRLGLLGELGIVLVELGMIVALHRVFRHAGARLSLAAAAARLGMVVAMGPSIVAGLAALSVGSAAPDLVLALMELRVTVQHVWEAAFAVHLALLSVLVSRSGRVPRLFGPLLAVAAGGYALNSLALLAAPSLLELTGAVVGVTAMLGEVPLFLWMLAMGVAPVRTSEARARSALGSAAAART